MRRSQLAEFAVQSFLRGKTIEQRTAKILVDDGVVNHSGLIRAIEIQTRDDKWRGIARDDFRRFADGARERQNVNVRLGLDIFDLQKGEKSLLHSRISEEWRRIFSLA